MSLLVSCDKGEIAVEKPIVSEQVVQVNMGGDYANQLFYNIYTNEVVLANQRETWDLGFQTGANESHILLNTSKMMLAVASTETDLLNITSDAGLVYKHDKPNGDLDSTAFVDWKNHDFVYVIDRGKSLIGTDIGKIKLKMLSSDNEKYIFEWAELSSTIIQKDTVYKDQNVYMTCFSFSSGQQVNIEPAKNDWQLLFSTYTHVYEDQTLYLVAGVLSNMYQIELSETNQDFATIDKALALTKSYSNDKDFIGFDWKEYNFDLSYYSIIPNKNYIIRDMNNRYFKLRFIDFYDQAGVKGAPKFEIKELL